MKKLLIGAIFCLCIMSSFPDQGFGQQKPAPYPVGVALE